MFFFSIDIETKINEFGVTEVTGVRTATGFIKTSRVVNCTGCWAPKIGAMVGAVVPLISMQHAYVTTERIEGVQNTPNVRDHDLSLYFRLQGDALAVGGYEPNPVFIDHVRMYLYSFFVIFFIRLKYIPPHNNAVATVQIKQPSF